MKDALNRVASRISDGEVRKALGRTERMNLLVTPGQKEEIRAAAERYGLSMTDYLIRIHSLVESRTWLTHRRKKG
jgi:hypothetical protein